MWMYLSGASGILQAIGNTAGYDALTQLGSGVDLAAAGLEAPLDAATLSTDTMVELQPPESIKLGIREVR